MTFGEDFSKQFCILDSQLCTLQKSEVYSVGAWHLKMWVC